MLKFFGLPIALSATFAVLLPIAAGDASTNPSNGSIAQLPPLNERDAPFCFMQTSDGRTLDLTALCDPNEPSQTVESASAPAVEIAPTSNLGGLRAVAESTGCFGLDAEGRPCPPVP